MLNKRGEDLSICKPVYFLPNFQYKFSITIDKDQIEALIDFSKGLESDCHTSSTSSTG